ncbi:hypothetical protein GCM10007157_29650 [Vreelandella hamiltonii]|uniref:Uncharacterized protein n=1 Tax=Vreelandella hamiltonii TaxID=502829 RepID=A0A8H9I5C7_9GAMM|nr:hypothetical protein GCM10007157_29650 [Halomonas hamiltonii]
MAIVYWSLSTSLSSDPLNMIQLQHGDMTVYKDPKNNVQTQEHTSYIAAQCVDKKEESFKR